MPLRWSIAVSITVDHHCEANSAVTFLLILLHRIAMSLDFFLLFCGANRVDVRTTENRHAETSSLNVKQISSFFQKIYRWKQKEKKNVTARRTVPTAALVKIFIKFQWILWMQSLCLQLWKGTRGSKRKYSSGLVSFFFYVTLFRCPKFP